MILIKKAQLVLAVFVAILAAITVFDIASYWIAPASFTSFAGEYRKTIISIPDYVESYPRGYFRADDLLGFDIQENINSSLFVFRAAETEIFSNDIGCFDKHSLKTIKNNKSYDYFAGDSFTWGFADFDKKFATVYERETSRFTVKCGVTHTGQLHQFDKFKKIVKAVGHYPKRVIVGYVPNDPINDFAHPHTTVIDGFLVNFVATIDGANLIERDMAEVKDAVEKWVSRLLKSQTTTFAMSAKAFLKKYSLSTHLFIFGKDELQGFLPSGARKPYQGLLPSATREPYQNLYELEKHVSFKEGYLTSSYTNRNREAILRWAQDARNNSYDLHFILIPGRKTFDDVDYFSGLRQFLREHGISFIDMSEVFSKSGKKMKDLYWTSDGHWNNEGNLFVGEVISKLID